MRKLLHGPLQVGYLPHLSVCVEVKGRMKGQHGLLWTSKGSPTNLVIQVVGQIKGLHGRLQVGYLSQPICLRECGWENEGA